MKPTYLIVALSLLFGLLATMPTGAEAQRFCRIDSVNFEGPQGTGARARVAVTCRADSFSGSLRYPDGGAFVGLTLFRVRNSDAVSVGDLGWEGSFLDLPYKPLDTTLDTAEIVLETPQSPRGFSKFVAAVWAEEVPCSDPSRAVMCLGPTEDYLPIPVDTFPRAQCDPDEIDKVSRFISANYFFDDGGVVYNFTDEDLVRINKSISSQHCVTDTGMNDGDLFPRTTNRLGGIGLGFAIGKWPVADVTLPR